LLSFAALLLLGALTLALGGLVPKVPVSGVNELTSASRFASESASGRKGFQSPPGKPPLGKLSLGQLPLRFEPNQGQTNPQVKFLARGAGYGLFLTPDQAVLTLSARKSGAVRMRLAGANPVAAVTGDDRLPGKSNYFIGNNPDQWHRNIPQFARVRYQRVYPGVDLVYYGKQGQLEYDFEVSPGADPKAIAFQFEGSKRAELDRNGDLVLATFDAALTSGSTALAVSATATEHILAAIDLAKTTIVVTDERFINLATGTSATWSAALGAAEAQTIKAGRVYGMAAQADKVLLAWGADMTLGLVVMDASGHVLAHVLDDKYLGYLAAQTTSAMPTADGLLLFDGNPVRMTQIDFALSRTELARNMQLLTFYRTVPRVAGVTLGGRPVGFWLSVFPSSDNSQDRTLHQLYGCALDLAAPAACAGTSLIATTDLGGYELEAQPVAAAALPGGDAVAIVHTDAGDRTWLRIADLRCARPRD